MYSILIKDKSNLYRFLTVKREIMTEENADGESYDGSSETVLVGTGKYETVRFETDSKEELEEKCIELLNTYNKNEFLAVNTEPYKMDLVWEEDEI